MLTWHRNPSTTNDTSDKDTCVEPAIGLSQNMNLTRERAQGRPVKAQKVFLKGRATGEKGDGRARSEGARHLISDLISSYCFPTNFPKSHRNDDVESVADSTSTLADIADMDPLIAAIYKNTVLNPLCRLPDEILLLIMSHLDKLALFCLRHSSRTFQRLFSSPDFQQYHIGSGREWVSQQTWYDREDLGQMLVRDRYCANCAHMRVHKNRDPRFKALMSQRLYCSPCKKTHPAALFSSPQRRASDRSRICIGHEGSFRVCDHVTLSWEDIERWVVMFADLEDYGLNTSNGILCDDAAHKHRCDNKSTYRARPDGLTGGVMLNLARDQDDLKLKVDWTSHMGLRGSMLSSLDMRKALETGQERGARHLVPPFRPGDASAMAAFDPNSCSCVYYPGSDRVPFELCAPREGRCRATNGESRSLETGGFHYTRLWPAHGLERCFTATRCALKCGDTDFHYSAKVDLNVFGRKEGQVVDPVWYSVVNPESYGLAEDEESRHILWCPRNSCGNYHKNVGFNRFRGIKPY